jgi:hypothetical protein
MINEVLKVIVMNGKSKMDMLYRDGMNTSRSNKYKTNIFSLHKNIYRDIYPFFLCGYRYLYLYSLTFIPKYLK